MPWFLSWKSWLQNGIGQFARQIACCQFVAEGNGLVCGFCKNGVDDFRSENTIRKNEMKIFSSQVCVIQNNVLILPPKSVTADRSSW